MVHPDVLNFFENGAIRFGKSHRAVGYFSEFTQQLRFYVLASELNWSQQHQVLDVGCGQGDLVGFCREEGYPCGYYGVDVSPSMIHIARSVFGDSMFKVQDFMDPFYVPEVDFVLGSGVANVAIENSMAYVVGLISKGFSVSRVGCGFNFLSSLTPVSDRKSQMMYYDPIDVMKFCFTLTPHVVLKHHYLPNDFTVCLFKP